MITVSVLDSAGIDGASERAASFLTESGMSAREVLAARLAFENALLDIRDELGEGAPMRLWVSRLYGRPRLLAAVQGSRVERLRQTGAQDSSPEEYAESLLSASGLSQTYAYRNGWNIVTLVRPRKPLSALLQIVAAFVIGAISAFAGTALIAQPMRTYLLEAIFQPIVDVFLGMLGGLAGPLVFLSVAWGVCGIGDVSMLGKHGRRLVTGFMRDNFCAAVAALLICIPVFSLPITPSSGNGDLLEDLVGLVLGLLPTNCITPFAEGNTSQIILMGIFVGLSALVLGSETRDIRHLLGSANRLVQFLMEQLVRFLPLFIFNMVVVLVWNGTFRELLSQWRPLLVAIVAMSLTFFVRLCYSCMLHRASVARLIAVLRPSMLIALTTASSTSALHAMETACAKDLGVPEGETSFGASLGMILAQGSSTVVLVVLMNHFMSFYGLGADFSWYVRLIIVSVLYAMVSPPVPGGMLMCYTLMFAQLGIPSAALGLITALDVILDYPMTCFRVGLIMLGTYDTATTSKRP